jgi:hypothetical protein
MSATYHTGITNTLLRTVQVPCRRGVAKKSGQVHVLVLEYLA